MEQKMIIDTHTHLDDNRYDNDLDIVIQRAKQEGVESFIIPGADPKTLKKALNIAQKYDDVYFAVGVHPYDASNYDRDFLEHFITHPKCVAVGECGLDYYRLLEDEGKVAKEKALQKEVFLDQIDLANKYNKPLIVHIRDASSDSLDILQSHTPKRGGVLHCYNADESLLKLKDKFYYGIGGVITFKNAKKLINIYPKIPLDRLIIETDAPYLTPHPHRGERNESAYTKLVAQKLSELSDMPLEKIEEITTKNAKKLFDI
jgi:TatD DNase family protein